MITESFALNTEIFKTPFVVRFEKMENTKRNGGNDDDDGGDDDDAEVSPVEEDDQGSTSQSGIPKAVSQKNLAYVGIDKHGVSLISEDGKTIIEINNVGASMKRKDEGQNVHGQKMESEKTTGSSTKSSLVETTPALSYLESATSYTVRTKTLPGRRITRRPKQSKSNNSSSIPNAPQSSETIRLYEVDSKLETSLNTFQVDGFPDENNVQFDAEQNKAKLKLINAGLILAVSVCLMLFVVLGAFLVMRGCDLLRKGKGQRQPRSIEIEPRFFGGARSGDGKDEVIPPSDLCAGEEKLCDPDEALISNGKENCNTVEWYV